MTEPTYEYAVMFTRYPESIHRGPFNTKKQAEEWIEEWIADGGRPEVMYIVRRPTTSEWERLPDDDEPTITENKEGCFPGPLSTDDARRSWGVPEIPEIRYVNIVPKPKHWHVRRVTLGAGYDSVGEASLNDLLENGWEPYAVTSWKTDTGSGFTHHLRKQS